MLVCFKHLFKATNTLDGRTAGLDSKARSGTDNNHCVLINVLNITFVMQHVA